MYAGRSLEVETLFTAETAELRHVVTERHGLLLRRQTVLFDIGGVDRLADNGQHLMQFTVGSAEATHRIADGAARHRERDLGPLWPLHAETSSRAAYNGDGTGA
jgi:hypothetical protein